MKQRGPTQHPSPHTFATTDPDPQPPQVHCPDCLQALVYRESMICGNPLPDRWDYFACREHGLFQFRHSTRSVRRLA
jgi:hypothetical protein